MAKTRVITYTLVGAATFVLFLLMSAPIILALLFSAKSVLCWMIFDACNYLCRIETNDKMKLVWRCLPLVTVLFL